MKGKKRVWNFVDYLKNQITSNVSLILYQRYKRFVMCTKRGHRLNLTSSGKASMAGPIDLETESNHIEHKNS